MVSDLSADIIRAFLADLERTRHCSIATRNQTLSGIHALARFIGERSPEYVQWCREVRAVPFKRAEKVPIACLEKEELDPLLSAPNLGTKLGQRDHALLLFFYNSGARASEAVRINVVEDLDFNPDGTGSVKLNGKGRKVRFCPLWAKTVGELLPLTRGRPADAPVFLNRYGDRMTRFGVYTAVKRYFRVAAKMAPSIERKRVSPHTLRHTTASHLLRAGVDINTIRGWLGHVSVGTTIIMFTLKPIWRPKPKPSQRAIRAAAPASETRNGGMTQI